MESLDLYRKAKALAQLGNKISSEPVRISDIYADLKDLHQERIVSDETSRLPSRDRDQNLAAKWEGSLVSHSLQIP